MNNSGLRSKEVGNIKKKNLQRNAKKMLAVLTAASMAGAPSVYAAAEENSSVYIQEEETVVEKSVGADESINIEAQPETILSAESDIPSEGTVPVVTDVPAQEETSRTEVVSETETLPGTEEVPEAEVTPEIEKVPGVEVMPGAEETSGTEVTPGAEEVPETEVTLGVEEVPETEAMPGEEEVLETEVMPGEEEVSGIEETPGSEGTLSEEEDPENVENPSAEEELAVDLLSAELQDGWVEENGNWCYYQNGEKLTDTEVSVYDEKTGQSYTYRVDADGNRLASAWYEDENGNKRYYDADGRQAEGLVEVDGSHYYFTDHMYTDMSFDIYDEETSTWHNYRADVDGHLVTGWYEDDYGRRYYYGTDCRMVTGVTEIDGETYYLEQQMQTDCAAVQDGYFYYFGEDGRMTAKSELSSQTQWIQEGENSYYVQDGELVRNKFLTIGGYTYYFGGEGEMYKGFTMSTYDDETESYVSYLFDDDGHMVTGWYRAYEEDPWHYYNEKGHEVKGIQTIGGVTYYFNDYGEMQSNTSVEVSGILYYFGADGKVGKQESLSADGWKQMPNGWYYSRSGKLVKNEWIGTGSSRYYINSSGLMAADTRMWITEEDGCDYKYCFDANGHVMTGWLNEGDEDWPAIYYYDENGRMVTGIQTIEGSTYYFDEYGEMQSSCAMDVDGTLYYFGSDGKAGKQISLSTDGWKQMPNGWYYVRAGELVKGEWIGSGSARYYMQPNGIMAENTTVWITEGDNEYNYRFDKNGHVVTGWYQDDDAWYYYDQNGHVVNGIYTISGTTYYFSSSGEMVTEYCAAVDENLYYFGEDGKMMAKVSLATDGWKKMPDGWYYAKGGNLVEGQWLKLGGHSYYMGISGKMYSNSYAWIYDDTGVEYLYRFDKDGHMVTGWYEDGDGQLYYYDENGHAADGVEKIGDSTYYFDWKGMIRTQVSTDYDGILYYFGKDGKAEKQVSLASTGWKKMPDGWYYAKDGKLIKEQWLKLGGYSYYMSVSGKMYSNSCVWIYDDTGMEYIYRFDKDGHMVTGWYWDGDGQLYYYHENGHVAEGIEKIEGNIYYFDSEGMVRTQASADSDGILYYFGKDGKSEKQVSLASAGWKKMPDGWYYAKDGILVKRQWLKIGGYSYYMGSSGKMYSNSSRLIYDGAGMYYYRFDEDGHMVIGWYEDGDGDLYYYHEDGRAAEGVQKIGGSTYYFDSDGMSCTQVSVDSDGILYYFGKDGKAEKQVSVALAGWKEMPDGWYYAKNGKLLKNQWLKQGESTYYFNDEGRMFANECIWIFDKELEGSLISYRYRFDEKGHMVTGWYEDGDGQLYYYDENGHAAKGIQKIGGSTYYFDSDGMVCTQVSTDCDGILYYFGKDGKVEKQTSLASAGWKKMPDGWYYAKNGKLVKGQWLKLGGYSYYMGSSGKMYSNCCAWIDNTGEEYGEEYAYRFDKDGHMVTGWYEDGDGELYYYHEDGHVAEGVEKIGNSTYYFDSDGMICKMVSADSDGILYYFGKDGKAEKQVSLASDGWKKMPDGWYYAKDGKLVKRQWLKLGGYFYYMADSGKMYSNICAWIYDNTGMEYVYRFDEDGHMVTGWYEDGDGQLYYYYEDGHEAKGVQKIGSSTYYFDSDGMMRTQVSADINGILYYFGKDGKAEKQVSLASDGWKKMPDGWYYAKSGEILRSEWLKLGDGTYYLNNEGKMICDSSYSVYDSETGKSYDYRFDKNGRMVTGWYQFTNGSDWYHYGKDGRASEGMVTIGGKNYYFKWGGYCVVNSKEFYDGKVYVIDGNGVCTLAGNGWIDDKYYVQNGNASVGWNKISEKWYYFDKESGEIYRGTHSINGKEYYFDRNGIMKTGWIKDSLDNWLYADSNGVLAYNQWCTISGKKYYFEYDRMATGICLADGKYHLFDKNGIWQKELTAQKNGWFKDGSDWYYMKDGKTSMDETCSISGKIYGFDSTGKMVKDVFLDDYYFSSTGEAVTNQWKRTGNSIWYYCGEDGKLVKTGWKRINGYWYYFENYCMVQYDKVIDGKLYKFASNGSCDGVGKTLKEGWNLVDGRYYYYQSGKLKKGWLTLGTKRYYFDNSGIMQYQSVCYVDGDYYFFDKNGEMGKGWCGVNGMTCYAGTDGKLTEGLQTIDGKKYFFRDHLLYTIDFVSESGKELYVITSDGTVQEIVKAGTDGWMKSAKGCWYYVKNGQFLKGRQVIGGKQYYFGDDGKMLENTLFNHIGFAGSDGALGFDGWFGNFYLINGATQHGAKTINGKEYYFNNTMPDNGVYFVDGAYYLYDGKGGRKTVSLKEGWNKFNGFWYYAVNGSLSVGRVEVNGKYYMFGNDGKMLSDCRVSNYEGNRFNMSYLDSNGLVVTGWKELNGGKYYFDSNGYALIGRHVIDGKTYIFDMSGRLIP